MCLQNVPSFRFFLCCRAVFCTLALIFGTVVPFFWCPRSGFGGPGNICQNHPFGNHPFVGTSRPLTGVSRTLRARNAEQVSLETSETVPETFLRLCRASWPESPGDIFETCSAFRARRVRESPVRGGLVPNPCANPRTIRVVNSCVSYLPKTGMRTTALTCADPCSSRASRPVLLHRDKGRRDP